MNPIGIHPTPAPGLKKKGFFFSKRNLNFEVSFRKVLRALNVMNDKKLMLTSNSTK